MARCKVTQLRRAPQDPTEQRFIDYAAAADVYWRLHRLHAAMELFQVQVPDAEDSQALHALLTQAVRKVAMKLMGAIHDTYVIGPGEVVVPAPKS